MNKSRNSSLDKFFFACMFAAFGSPAAATEGGGSIYPHGAENFVMAVVPPPGTYLVGYGTRYVATSLRDNNGNDISAAVGGFRLEANVIAPRLVWVTDQQVLGGQLVFHAILPLADLDLRVGLNRGSKTGIGDATLAAGLGYHASEKAHYVFAVEANMPTGRYNRNDLINIGRNHWNIQPLAAFSYLQPSGINADAKVMYDFNFRNSDTDYKSGRELHVDYSLGWGLGNGWVAGIGGYAYRQVSDDEQGGRTIPGNRGRSFAIGPAVKFRSSNGWFITAKYERQSGVRNRADGSSFWLKTIIPF